MTYSFISGGTAPLIIKSLPVLSCAPGSSGRKLGALVLIDWVKGFAFLGLDPNLHVKLVLPCYPRLPQSYLSNLEFALDNQLPLPSQNLVALENRSL